MLDAIAHHDTLVAANECKVGDMSPQLKWCTACDRVKENICPRFKHISKQKEVKEDC